MQMECKEREQGAIIWIDAIFDRLETLVKSVSGEKGRHFRHTRTLFSAPVAPGPSAHAALPERLMTISHSFPKRAQR